MQLLSVLFSSKPSTCYSLCSESNGFGSSATATQNEEWRAHEAITEQLALADENTSAGNGEVQLRHERLSHWHGQDHIFQVAKIQVTVF